ncbi:MAG: type IX secretion system sortase PorU [Bacteroidota bacterium]
MRVYATIFACWLIAGLRLNVQAQHPLFSQGQWAKFSVEKNGIYKIDYELLKKAGFNPDAINPNHIRLVGYPTGMLPQPNSVVMPNEPLNVAIKVVGGEDGKFNTKDYVVFYGQGPDRLEYNAQRNVFAYENNLYSDKNFYFLTVDGQGSHVATSAVQGATGAISQYLDVAYYETDNYNSEKSGREWFGESFATNPELTIRFALPGIVADSEIKVVSSVMAQTYQPSSFRLFWNGNQLLDRPMAVIPETQYGIKGRVNTDTLVFNANNVGANSSANQDVRYQYIKAPGYSQGYLNYLLFQVTRQLAWYGQPTFFTIPPVSEAVSTLTLSSPPAGLEVWDITNPFAPVAQKLSIGASARFDAETGSAKTFVAFVASQAALPLFEEKMPNQNLLGLPTPDLLVVTHPDFLEQAQRLANHRANHNGLAVAVVTTQQIFNQFSGGRQDVSAIRNFVRHLYKQSPGQLKNLLLFGRGSYDYKNRVFNNSNYVPTYESRNSLSPLETYSSDDYFAFLEDNEGEWSENPARNHTLDIGVGRLPVRTATDAATVVDKLIAYDTNPNRYAGWRQEVLFVADDGDFNIHQSQADELAELVEAGGGFSTNKVYLDAYEQESRPSGQVSPQATEALSLKLNKGFAIVNFTGHGSEQVWMQERILDVNTPSQLTNQPRLPLFVTATCEFGRHDNPLLISTAELLLLRKNGGAIALVTTARPVNSGTNFSLNKAFYAALFEGGANQDLGTLFKETKNRSQSGVANRNFSLLGDPSMRFGPPEEKLVVTRMQTATGSDTLKALSKVVLEGRVMRNGGISTDFNGTLEATLFDKRVTALTKGDENPPFSYSVWPHVLFRGRASVQQGEFYMEMMLPANLVQEVGQGKLALYAHTTDQKREALGTFTDLKIGEAEAAPPNDNRGPAIQLFMSDTTFVNGGYTNANTHLVGLLTDESGINLSGYEPGNLVAVLDGEKTFVVNDYYVASKDDFTSGSFSYPLFDLSPGRHTIRFTAADNHNNESVATIEFEVGEQNALLIEELINYPNPFSESTVVEFSHSRSGEDLQAQVVIYDVMGQLAGMKEFYIPASTYKVRLFEWNGTGLSGTKMGNGVYLMKLSVRSLHDGAKKEKIAKLILVN